MHRPPVGRRLIGVSFTDRPAGDLLPPAASLSLAGQPFLGTDRAGYFERCWPGAGQHQRFEFVGVVEAGNEVIVTAASRW